MPRFHILVGRIEFGDFLSPLLVLAGALQFIDNFIENIVRNLHAVRA